MQVLSAWFANANGMLGRLRGRLDARKPRLGEHVALGNRVRSNRLEGGWTDTNAPFGHGSARSVSAPSRFAKPMSPSTSGVISAYG